MRPLVALRELSGLSIFMSLFETKKNRLTTTKFKFDDGVCSVWLVRSGGDASLQQE